ncbi:P-loop containing nucleoside triphosphate hydrolase protein [Heliocybe sulcata]|uniref:P-loop containing nucleoside triphosphate hydrolase protein n=1 Tax=Heliocybe sulcata TaxID=5364 RepID=A0A5C3MX65_9AGAM|nr:P-loop containing nucleoside triphosphate hydrolase protein [Heliocybe sulcata]
MLALSISAPSAAARACCSRKRVLLCSRSARQHRTLASSSSRVRNDDGEGLTATEKEWLQEDDVEDTPVSQAYEEALVSPDSSTKRPRFDWRQTLFRARREKGARRAQPEEGRRRYIQRVDPDHEQNGPQNPFYTQIQAYNDHFLPLLDAERRESEAVIKERLSNWSLERLKQEGYCLTELSAFWLQGTQFGRPVASFTLGPGISLPEGHRFENGTQILLSRLDPLKEDPLRGSVVNTTAGQIKISFPELHDLDSESLWRLDVGSTNIIYERMRAAIRCLNLDPSLHENELVPSLQETEQQSNKKFVPERQVIMQGTFLRDKLLRSFAPAAEASTPLVDIAGGVQTPPASERSILCQDMRIQSWVARYSRPNPVRVEGDPVIAGLNDTQVRAIAMMLGHRLSLVQGPPGTGKTKTIIEAVKLLKVHFQIVHPVMVCTYTNVAVDNLVEGLVKGGLKPLRIGFGGKVKTSLHEYTLEAKLEQHRLRAEYDNLVKQEEVLAAEAVDLAKKIAVTQQSKFAERESRMTGALALVDNRRRSLRSQMYGLRQEMLQDIVHSADVVCTTCLTSASAALRVIDFPIVFLDEASMSTEPVSLIPLTKGSQQVCLIGDHKQLPPIVSSREAQTLGLGISMFERLAEEGGVPSIMLDVQYRMHPAISRFPSLEFYQFSVRDGTKKSDGTVDPHLLPPRSRYHPATGDRPSVIFLDHAGSEQAKDRSRINLLECQIVCDLVEDLLLLNENMSGEDIGIIAPYAAQKALLKSFLRAHHGYRERFMAALGQQRAMQLANVEIKTVDGFEGREKDVIIFSTVRNNAGGQIGFLADRRRLNVGLTRAKRGLFVVGSLSTLRKSMGGWWEERNGRVGKDAEAWRKYAQFVQKEGLVQSGERPRQAAYPEVPSLRGVVMMAKYDHHHHPRRMVS